MNIIKYKNISFVISSVLFLVSVILLATIGLKPGIDFTGGSLVELSFVGSRPSVQEMRDTLAPLSYGMIETQPTGDDGYILRMRFISEDEHQVLLSTVRNAFQTSTSSTIQIDATASTTVEAIAPSVIEQRVETIGASISSHLKSRSLYAGIAVILAIIAYVAYAFRRVSKPVQSWKYGVSAVIALIHDVTITMGVFVLLGKYAGVEVDIPFIVALLTILGYSVNDTIVVFDRIRENLVSMGSDRLEQAIVDGVKSTLVRSFNTSFTTLLVLFAMYFFGGESIKYFSLALIVGIGFGTYSSIFLASPLLYSWQQLAIWRRGRG